MTGGMAWESPPPPHHGYDWGEIARSLRANPHEWLRVFDSGPVSIVNAIRQGSIAALTPVIKAGYAGGFEVRTRNNSSGPPRVCTLYLRFVPTQEGGQ